MKSDHNSIELWAGLEHTINRVQDSYKDQIAKIGLEEGLPDFSLLKDLGLKKFRCPFLWEKIAVHDNPEKLNWDYCEQFLNGLKQCEIEPIAGFLHHGSGPAFTNLLDTGFAEKFQYFARKFAEKFPQVKYYTPINEPLTTARFSGLYGHWYPHKTDDHSFIRALYNQIKAIILAMREIRKINPLAQLIQTEDLGRTQSSENLKYQCDFENERRYLSFDLLQGKVDQSHALYDYLKRSGLTDDELIWLKENSLKPDVIGLNHYLLSSRYLDEDYSQYPHMKTDGNGIHRYADVAAVDKEDILSPTPESLFRETWRRYKIPLAITEVHLRGYREDQMRWLYELKTAAEKVSKEEIPVIAITAWSLYGAMDWNTLCTQDNYFYESGVFDLRSQFPRRTALANMLKDWHAVTKEKFPVLEQAGWWKKEKKSSSGRPILVTGARGSLGQAFLKICLKRNIHCIGLTREELDITDQNEVLGKIRQLKPWAIINAAGYVRVDRAETEQKLCRAQNILGPTNLAKACADEKIQFLHFSSDLVFSGDQQTPYTEDQPVNPLNIYGKTKAESEKEILNLNSESLIVRTSSFFSPWDTYNFIFKMLSAVSQNKRFTAVSDITISPTYVPDLVNLCLDLLLDRELGIVHLVNNGALTWSDFALKAIEIGQKKELSLSSRYLNAVSGDEMNFLAKRPAYSALTSNRIRIMSDYEEALHRYFDDTTLFTNSPECL